MSCCNKSKCSNKQDTAAPAEALGVAELNSFGVWILDKLLAVAKTGQLAVDFKNTAAQQLATTIANLIDENHYLRAVLRVFSPTATVTPETFTLRFGPGQHYQLHLPLASDMDRRQLIDTLEAALTELKKTPPEPQPKQQLLFDRHQVL